MKAEIAQQAMQGAYNLATQQVIGYSKSKTTTTKKSVKTESTNIGIQAWEIGGILAGLGILEAADGAYEFLTGDSGVMKSIKSSISQAGNVDKKTLTGQGLPQAKAKATWLSNFENFFSVID